MAEFHTELERLPAKEVQNNVYIKHPVSLEQYIMEGSYNKVLFLIMPLFFHTKLIFDVNSYLALHAIERCCWQRETYLLSHTSTSLTFS